MFCCFHDTLFSRGDILVRGDLRADALQLRPRSKTGLKSQKVSAIQIKKMETKGLGETETNNVNGKFTCKKKYWWPGHIGENRGLAQLQRKTNELIHPGLTGARGGAHPSRPRGQPTHPSCQALLWLSHATCTETPQTRAHWATQMVGVQTSPQEFVSSKQEVSTICLPPRHTNVGRRYRPSTPAPRDPPEPPAPPDPMHQTHHHQHHDE